MAYQIDVISDFEQFRLLKPEWDALWLSAARAGVVQTFDFCLHTWQTVAGPAKHELFCLVVREEDRLVAVWPLTRYRKLLWRIVSALSPTGAEVTDVLIHEGTNERECIKALWHLLASRSHSDLINLPPVRVGSELDRVLSCSGQKLRVESDAAPYAYLKDKQDWDSYYKSLSDSHRKKHGNLRRRLAERGAVKFEIIEAGDSRCPQLIEWMLSQKKVWAERVNKKGYWLYSERFREFLTRLMADPAAIQRRLIFSLMLDDAPIAVKLVAISKSTVELLIAGFDANYDRYSPGMRLDEHWVKWALEHKLDCDFGSGREHYKMFWARNNMVETAKYQIAVSTWGYAFGLSRTLRDFGRRLHLRRSERPKAHAV